MATKGSSEVDRTLAAWLLDPPSEGTVLATLREIATEHGALAAVVAPRGYSPWFSLPGRPTTARLVRLGEATAGRRVCCRREDPVWEALIADVADETGLDWLVAEPFGPGSTCSVLLVGAGAPPHDLTRLARAAALTLERAPTGPASAEAAHKRGNLIAAVVYNLDYAAALLEEQAKAAPGSSPHDPDLRQAVQNARDGMARLRDALLLRGTSAQAVRGGTDDDDARRHPDGEMP